MVRKNTLIALSFSVFIAVLTPALMFALYQKWYVEPLYEKYPEALHPYIDPDPFVATKYGKFALATWAALALTWISYAYTKNKKALFTIALSLCIMLFLPIIFHV